MEKWCTFQSLTPLQLLQTELLLLFLVDLDLDRRICATGPHQAGQEERL